VTCAQSLVAGFGIVVTPHAVASTGNVALWWIAGVEEGPD